MPNTNNGEQKMNSKAYNKHFEKENGLIDAVREYEFRYQIFNEWKSSLVVGDKMEICRPNHTCRNNSARFFNHGVCEVVEIKKESVIFQKEGGRKIIYTANDLTVNTNDYFNKRCNELLK